jgi:penicillin-binding protein 1A
MLPFLAAALASGGLGVMVAGFAAYYYLRPALPSVAEMRDIPLQIPLRIYTRDGRLLQQVGEKRRTPVRYEEIPPRIVNAFLAAEDDRFFEHPGFDYQGIIRAAVKLVLTGSRSQGGSTITQQLAREYFLSRDRTFIRKAKELILATQIEASFSKEEILALYLNKTFLGQRAYGVAAAAQVYFGKELAAVSVAEAATIAGLPAAPSRLNPVSNPDLARDRRSYVLRRMRELDFIDDAEYTTAMNTPMESFLHAPAVEVSAPYVAEMARSEMVRRFGQAAYTDGYQVVTTIDSRLQEAANQALRTALLEYDRRHGYRGPVDRIDIAELVAEYGQRMAADNATVTESELRSAALQEHLNNYQRHPSLVVAVVVATRPDNSAEFFVRDSGAVTVTWERLRWKPYINDNVIGGEPADINAMLAPGDVVYLLDAAQGWQLAQLPEAQGAFVALDPHDGATLALTGGYDYYASKFNRAVQAQRQPGSSFKPFIYSAALDNGFTAATVVNDAPIVINNTGQEEAWRPENYSNRFYGPTRLREGLVRSMNLVSLRVLREVGIGNALRHIQPFGFPPAALPRDLSLALGSGGTSPAQLAKGFAVFASGGYAVDNYLVERILDADGAEVYRAEPLMVCQPCAPRWFDGREAAATEPGFAPSTPAEPQNAGDAAAEIPAYTSAAEMLTSAADWRPDYRDAPLFWQDRNQAPRVITEQNAYIVYDMMRDVIRRGTGRRARTLGRSDIAGKTGTSNDRRDAWFSGFNADIVGVAWVGFDDDARSLGAGEEGSRTALPMWKDFMAVALADTPAAPLKTPPGIVTARISKTTGEAALTGADTTFELFRSGNEPRLADDATGFDGGTRLVGDDSAESIF